LNNKKVSILEKTFAPIVKWVTTHVVVVLAIRHNWNIKHLDVKTTFLNNDLVKEVYMKQPQGFEVLGKEHQVS
jgi:hypothetical protein